MYPLLSIYEKTSIIGLRLSQLEHGAKTTLSPEDVSKCKSIKQIVEMEFKKQKIPFKIIRENKEISINELVIP